MRTAHIGACSDSDPPMAPVSQLLRDRVGAPIAAAVKGGHREPDMRSMRVARIQRPTALLTAVILGSAAVSACDVDPEWSRPDATTPDYVIELENDAEEMSERLRRDAEELADLFDDDPFGEDDGLASIGVP